jgi:ribosomal protein L12E/L44/L45/RPP1/RPP2
MLLGVVKEEIEELLEEGTSVVPQAASAVPAADAAGAHAVAPLQRKASTAKRKVKESDDFLIGASRG